MPNVKRPSCPYIGILIWGNLLPFVSRIKGISPTIRLIRRLAALAPADGCCIEDYSRSIDRLVKRKPFLFWARHRTCLIRGLLLYYFGKRNRLEVRLSFGSKPAARGFDTHCWIVLEGTIRFEVDEVIKQYTPLIEYV